MSRSEPSQTPQTYDDTFIFEEEITKKSKTAWGSSVRALSNFHIYDDENAVAPHLENIGQASFWKNVTLGGFASLLTSSSKDLVMSGWWKLEMQPVHCVLMEITNVVTVVYEKHPQWRGGEEYVWWAITDAQNRYALVIAGDELHEPWMRAVGQDRVFKLLLPSEERPGWWKQRRWPTFVSQATTQLRENSLPPTASSDDVTDCTTKGSDEDGEGEIDEDVEMMSMVSGSGSGSGSGSDFVNAHSIGGDNHTIASGSTVAKITASASTSQKQPARNTRASASRPRETKRKSRGGSATTVQKRSRQTLERQARERQAMGRLKKAPSQTKEGVDKASMSTSAAAANISSPAEAASVLDDTESTHSSSQSVPESPPSTSLISVRSGCVPKDWELRRETAAQNAGRIETAERVEPQDRQLSLTPASVPASGSGVRNVPSIGYEGDESGNSDMSLESDGDTHSNVTGTPPPARIIADLASPETTQDDNELERSSDPIISVRPDVVAPSGPMSSTSLARARHVLNSALASNKESHLMADSLKISMGARVLRFGTGSNMEATSIAKNNPSESSLDNAPESVPPASSNAQNFNETDLSLLQAPAGHLRIR